MQLLHPDLDARTFQFEEALLDEIRDSYLQVLAPILDNPQNRYLFEGGQSHRATVGKTGSYFAQSFESYPLLWLSNNNAETYGIYRRFFHGLGIESEIKKLVDYRDKIVMYCGFLVIGDRAPSSQWHNDYAPDANAFTLITPLFEPDPGHGNLLYKVGNETRTYRYKLGEAVFFGEKTAHTTEPYEQSAKKRVLVSMTFGTDKIEYWPQLQSTLDSQSQYFMLPCGHVYGTCNCLKTTALERLGKWVYKRLVPTAEITH